uniref:Uncharacterized protein LOC104225814 n=2 Tax=Nicotiana sylvestris TaxID=4096 RepID=A0A1U7WMU5_NICSY|nr:PREDICTED: uncharacterized protein LOC104225814 [Nicotiana sylvestris]
MELATKDQFHGIEKTQCLIGNIFSDIVFDTRYVECMVQRIWYCEVRVTRIRGNMFEFYFKKGDDCYRVLRAAPWTVQGGCLLILSPLFSGNIPWELHFLVQVHGLPTHYFTHQNAFKIGRYLGKYLYVDKGVWSSKFLRIRVRFDITNPLVSGFWLNSSWIRFKYEGLGQFCYKCGRIGHYESTCKFPPPPGNERFGPWLRVESLSLLKPTKTEDSITVVQNHTPKFKLIPSPKLQEWQKISADQHLDNLDTTPPKSEWERLTMNGVDSMIMMVNCVVIRHRVAEANEVEAYGLLILMMVAYFFYLVVKFNVIVVQRCSFFQKCDGTKENSIAEYSPVTQLKDLFILLMFCVTFLMFC